MTKILVVDDHELFRQGVVGLFNNIEGYEIIGSAGNSKEIEKVFKNAIPDIILMDIGLKNEDGIEISKKILEKYPDIKIIILSMYQSYEYAVRAFESGIKGYVLKESAFNELLDAVSSVSDGEIYVNDAISKMMANAHIRYLKNKDNFYESSLTDKEKTILKLLADGMSSKEIAAKLNVSPKTVDAHKIKIMNKMGFNSLAEIIKYAIRQGITS